MHFKTSTFRSNSLLWVLSSSNARPQGYGTSQSRNYRQQGKSKEFSITESSLLFNTVFKKKKTKMLWNPCGFWLWFGTRIEAWFLVAWAICSQDPGLLQTSRCLSFSVHTTSTQLQPSATRCQRLRIDFSLHPASRPPLGNHHKESRVGVREQRTWETATDIWLITLWHAFAPCCFDLKSSYLGILKRIKSTGGEEWNTICRVLRTSVLPP